jgi:hypothetical protein
MRFLKNVRVSRKFTNKATGALAVPAGLWGILVPFSMLIGWNLITLLLFWFVLIPVLTFYLPVVLSKSSNHLPESLAGLVLFYGIMVFMIFDHYKSDYFQVMVLSGVINLVLLWAIYWVKKPATENPKGKHRNYPPVP